MSPSTALTSCLLAALAFGGAAAQAANESSHPAAPERSQRAQAEKPGARDNNPEGEGTTKSAPAFISKADRDFVTKAAGSSLYEMEAAKLAESRAADPRLKAFAQTLQRDHQRAFEGLKQISLQHNYPLPEQSPEDKTAILARLKSLSGKEFDTVFRLQVGIEDHREDIKLLERARRTTRTADIRVWIDQSLPVMRHHLEQAQAM